MRSDCGGDPHASIIQDRFDRPEGPVAEDIEEDIESLPGGGDIPVTVVDAAVGA
jgi:hypothetical protein